MEQSKHLCLRGFIYGGATSSGHGSLLKNQANDVINMFDRIEQEFHTMDNLTGGDLYFGLAESFQIRYLVDVIRNFKIRYPGFKYHVTSGDTDQVTEKLQSGLIDFAVICDTPDTRKFNHIKFPESK